MDFVLIYTPTKLNKTCSFLGYALIIPLEIVRERHTILALSLAQLTLMMNTGVLGKQSLRKREEK